MCFLAGIVITDVLLQNRGQVHSGPINIMLIVIDALRPDHLGCYGYERKTSPNIDTLAKQGMRFSEAISASGWTGESVPSILTGVYPPTHQIRSWDSLRNPSIQTVTQILNSRGYHCVFWSNHGSMELLDIKDGFRELYLKNKYEGDKPFTTDYQLTEEIISFLERQDKNKPFFLYVHYSGAHVPYRPPPPYKFMYLYDIQSTKSKRIPICTDTDKKYKGEGCIPAVVAENNITDPHYYISQYDGVISYLDSQIGLLMNSLARFGFDKNTMIILLSDHGEMLGEHGIYFNHAGGYEGGYEENIKVPLIIKDIGQFARGKVIAEQVSLIDIAPTILEAIRLEKPSYMHGESLLAFNKPFKTYSKKYAFCFFGEGDWVVIRIREWKLIHNYLFKSWKLYNLKNDPQENHNLIKDRPDMFEHLKQELDNFERQITPLTLPKESHPLSQQDKERLRNLGYAQ